MPTSIPVKNTNQTNHLKVVSEVATVDQKTKQKTWKPQVNSPVYIKPGQSDDFWIGENNRITVTEMPT